MNETKKELYKILDYNYSYYLLKEEGTKFNLQLGYKEPTILKGSLKQLLQKLKDLEKANKKRLEGLFQKDLETFLEGYGHIDKETKKRIFKTLV